MTAGELVAEAAARGVDLQPTPDGGLFASGPAEAMTPALLERLEAMRSEVIAELGGEPAPEDPAAEEARLVFLERLGVADDQGMPTGIGSEAWRVAVALALAAADSVARGCARSHGTA